MIALRIKSCRVLDKVLECLERHGYFWALESDGYKPTESRYYNMKLPIIDINLLISTSTKTIGKGPILFDAYIIEVIK